VFSKEEYMKSLIQNNIHSENPIASYGNIIEIKCICGEGLTRCELCAYFDRYTIDKIYEEIKTGRKKLEPSEEEKQTEQECYLCKGEIKESNEYEYNCVCGIRGHELCIEYRPINKYCPRCDKILTRRTVPPSKKKWRLPCCKEEIEDKEIFKNALIELNKKKMSSNVERVICPFCFRTLDRANMKKILTTTEINSILKALSVVEPVKEETNVNCCSKCAAELNKGETFISFGCEHKYHVLCAKAVLESEDSSTALPKCTAKNCRRLVHDTEGLLKRCNEIMAKNCACCSEPGTRFVLLKCKHYVCKKCGENFRSGKNKYLARKYYILQVDCKICDEEMEAVSLILQCGHSMSYNYINSLYTTLRSYIISCKECLSVFDDVELYAALGKEKADKELEKIDENKKRQEELKK
jgi:hypothetical protein